LWGATWTGPDYLVNRADTKIEGRFGEKTQKLRNSCCVKCGDVAAHRKLTKAQIEKSPRIKYKRSKNFFFVIYVAGTLERLGTQLLQVLA